MNSVPHRLWYLKTWIPVGGAVWGRVGNVALPQEEWYWRWALRPTASSYIKFALSVLCVCLKAVCCQLLLLRLHVVVSFYLSGTEKTK